MLVTLSGSKDHSVKEDCWSVSGDLTSGDPIDVDKGEITVQVKLCMSTFIYCLKN